jgi:hypothetical protein
MSTAQLGLNQLVGTALAVTIAQLNLCFLTLTGAGSRRRGKLPRLPLPRHGENAWLRGTYRLGRGDDVRAAGASLPIRPTSIRRKSRLKKGFSPTRYAAPASSATQSGDQVHRGSQDDRAEQV